MPLRTYLLTLGINHNFATRNKNVPKVERQHRVIKERAQACRHVFPFQSVTTAYARGNREQLCTMPQHVPTQRRNQIHESKNLDDGNKVGLQETLSIAFRLLCAGTQRTTFQ